MRILAPVLLTLTIAAGCATTPTGTAVDRLRGPAADHAAALAGDDVAAMRATGRALLAQLGAFAGW